MNKPERKIVKCPDCGGDGWIFFHSAIGDDFEKRCPKCRGKGTIPEDAEDYIKRLVDSETTNDMP